MADAEDQSQKYDQAFFLALAAKGKDAWNAWRRDPANKDVRVTFAGIDFSEAPRDQINFAGFEFGDYAEFSGSKWLGAKNGKISEAFEEALYPNFHKPGRASFAGAAFGHSTNFTGATFDTNATFAGAAFGGGADFTASIFNEMADFTGAAFGDDADFTSASFNYLTNFRVAAFGNEVRFMNVAFRDLATFAGAAFGSGVLFSQTLFNDDADFTGMSKEQWTATVRALFSWMDGTAFVALVQRHDESWKRRGSGPDRFLSIWFPGARFYGEARFSDRSFEKSADFSGARFYYAPEFDWTGNFARFDFKSAEFGLARPGKLHRTAGTKLPSLLRAMRKAAEEARDHDFERDLFIAERKAELGINWHSGIEILKKEGWKNWPRNVGRLIAHIIWNAVMGAYGALANYGRSVVWPFAWLIASGFFFYWRYTQVLAQLMAKAPDVEKYKLAVRMLALGNTVPFVGPLTIDSKVKEFLFCPCRNCPDPMIPPEGYQWLVLGQNLFSITCVFFIGLALRNYFKIK